MDIFVELGRLGELRDMVDPYCNSYVGSEIAVSKSRLFTECSLFSVRVSSSSMLNNEVSSINTNKSEAPQVLIMTTGALLSSF